MRAADVCVTMHYIFKSTPVAAVRERGDDEAAIIAQVLVRIQLTGVDHLTCDAARFSCHGTAGWVGTPVVPQLGQPVKVSRVTQAQLVQLGRDVPEVGW